MSGELVPDRRHVRISSAERERVIDRLNLAVQEGRLTFAEFEERVDGVLRARTFAEVEPFLADLPGPAGLLADVPDEIELRAKGSSLKRTGRWTVPRRLRLVNYFGSIKLNFVDAVIAHPAVEIVVDSIAGEIILILPRGAVADVNASDLIVSSLTSKVPAPGDAPANGPVFVVKGVHRAGNMTVRHERRLWRWRW